MRKRLTKTVIDKLRHDPALPDPQVMYDELPNFGVRVYRSGTKSFVCYYRIPGERGKLATLGRYGILTLDEARKRAKQCFAEVARGNDPFAKKRQVRKAASFEQLAEAYIAWQSGVNPRTGRVRKKTWKKDKQHLDKHVLPKWRNRKIVTISRSDVEQLHNQMSIKRVYKHDSADKKEVTIGGPYVANRVLEVLRRMFNVAEQLGFSTEGNPAAKVEPNEERERHRILKPDEEERLI